jgi:hypothetical protein
MNKNYGLRRDSTWEEVRPDASINDYILIFDFNNFCIFSENTYKKYIEAKNDLDNSNQ